MENYCRTVLFSDIEVLWRTVAGRYCFLIGSQYGELLKEGIVCVAEPVWGTVAEGIAL